MIFADIVFFYLLIGLLLYVWAFMIGRHNNEPLSVIDLVILMLFWPVLMWVACARAAKKRDQWKED
jgi:hypothetical protein